MTRVYYGDMVFYVGGSDQLDLLESETPGPDAEYEATELYERMRHGLSDRELRILEGLASGVTAAEMAAEEGVALSRMRALIMDVRRKVREKVGK